MPLEVGDYDPMPGYAPLLSLAMSLLNSGKMKTLIPLTMYSCAALSVRELLDIGNGCMSWVEVLTSAHPKLFGRPGSFDESATVWL